MKMERCPFVPSATGTIKVLAHPCQHDVENTQATSRPTWLSLDPQIYIPCIYLNDGGLLREASICLRASYQLLSFGSPSGILEWSVRYFIRGQFHFLSVKKTNHSQEINKSVWACFLHLHTVYILMWWKAVYYLKTIWDEKWTKRWKSVWFIYHCGQQWKLIINIYRHTKKDPQCIEVHMCVCQTQIKDVCACVFNPYNYYSNIY